MLRVAILSGWHVHAEGYAQEFSELKDVKLTAVWDEDKKRGKYLAEKFGMEYVSDLDALLARSDVDAVSVTTPTNMHREVIIKAAKAGKHVFTEKVFAATVKEANEMRTAIKGAGVKFCISFPHRCVPHNLYAKKVADEGLLGKITFMRVRNAHNGASAGWLPPHFYDSEQCQGGAMMDLGAHPNYLAAYFLGKPARVVSVFNTTACPAGVEDNAVSVIEFENKAVAVVETGFLTPKSANTIEIEGTGGALVIENGVLRYQTRESDGWIVPERLPEPLPPVPRRWMDAVLYGKELPAQVGIEAAVTLTALIESEYIAHREGRAVTVEG